MATPELSLFADFAPRPPEHFRLCFFGSVLGVMEGVAVAAGSFEKGMERFPFLASYNNQLAQLLSGLALDDARDQWCAQLDLWEQATPSHLPLRALQRASALTHAELLWLMTVGLIEEDGRFGALFETLQGIQGQRRPSLGLLLRCLPLASSKEHPADLLLRLHQLGALELLNREAPRQEWIFRFPYLVWDALRTSRCHLDPQRMRYRPPEEAIALGDVVGQSTVQAQLAALPSWLNKNGAGAIVIRGPRHNGRRTVLSAIAKERGQGVLELTQPEANQLPNWTEAGLLAVLLNAMPVIELAGAPGEPVFIPDLHPASLCVGVAAGMGSGLAGPRARNALVLDLDLPDRGEREQLWRQSQAQAATPDLDAVIDAYRLSSGNIKRTAQLASSKARLVGRSTIGLADVLEATRALERQGLDQLAHRLPPSGNLGLLCASSRTTEELQHLLRRCRHREALPVALANAPAGRPSCGVRALFTGPSGTGKTLAARLLAGTLQKDLYRLDLSAVVNKYIGETEKNLQRLFECAMELDVILLLDEGDALLTRRTDVHTANDRYANLETNFLLQRIESFAGILIITTNARERIDSAFERRMDLIVEFSPPSAEERWELWQRHLPATARVDHARLAEISSHCELTGGQIYNAVVYAMLLALDADGVVTSPHVDSAVRREYRKRGAVCPLRA